MKKSKKYLVVGTWVDKSTNQPKSNLAEISSGINKDGKPYEIANTESREQIDEKHAVGTILEFAMERVSPAKPVKSSADSSISLKLQ